VRSIFRHRIAQERRFMGREDAIDIHQGTCATMGDVAVPFRGVTADGAGAINASVTTERHAPAGLLPHTALNLHLDAGAQLGGPSELGYAPIARGDITAAVVATTLGMAPVGQHPQGSADLTYDPGSKTLIVATSATGLAPGSAHAQYIGLGTCEAQGAAKYPLNGLVALASGAAYQTTVLPMSTRPRLPRGAISTSTSGRRLRSCRTAGRPSTSSRSSAETSGNSVSVVAASTAICDDPEALGAGLIRGSSGHSSRHLPHRVGAAGRIAVRVACVTRGRKGRRRPRCPLGGARRWSLLPSLHPCGLDGSGFRLSAPFLALPYLSARAARGRRRAHPRRPARPLGLRRSIR
jgi:hypothetical protein